MNDDDACRKAAARRGHRDVSNVSALQLGTHTGTHVDAPAHLLHPARPQCGRRGGLDLRGVSEGPYRLLCLPLRLVGANGAPARVLLVEEGD